VRGASGTHRGDHSERPKCPPEGRGKAVVDCNARISCHCHAAVRAKPAGGHGHASPSWCRQCGGRVKARVGASPLAWPRFGGAPTAAVTVTSAERFATKRGVRKGALQDSAPGRGRPAQPNDAAGRRAIFLRRITIVPRLAPRFLAKGAIPKSGFADALVCASLRWVSPAASAQNGSPAPRPRWEAALWSKVPARSATGWSGALVSCCARSRRRRAHGATQVCEDTKGAQHQQGPPCESLV
jgi:hypothetical protein